MDLANRTVLILGGSGLVGHAVSRRLLELGPARLVLVGLFADEVEEAARALEPHRGDAVIETAWGNVLLPAPAAQVPLGEALGDPELRRIMVDDLLGALTADVLERSHLFRLFKQFRPHAVVDCINTATAFAYRDVFQSARGLLASAHEGQVTPEQVELHVLTLTMPQLIRHVQVVSAAVREFKTQAYVKIGTSGTGGMGLNVPYTHSEEWPSRTLLAKSAVAGAHSLLLFLLGRTPGAPATVEIKPTAAIAWRRIGYGPIRRKGGTVARYDCPTPLPLDEAFTAGADGWVDTGEILESVFIDTGENGMFARDEFETVTSLGSMEFITPEEVAQYVVLEMAGQPTGRDIVAALDAASAGPTYRAGMLRAHAIERLRALEDEHSIRSVAFEMLGPPRLTKHLYEGFIWSKLATSVGDLASRRPADLAASAAQLVAEDGTLRSFVLSIGLPIVVEGDRVYRGEAIIVPPQNEPIEAVIPRGWVDLRVRNCETWIGRARAVLAQHAAAAAQVGSGSDEDWDAMRPDDPVQPPKFAAWIFKYEDDGERIKR
ncbi:MAG TPA: hypothetical protein VGA37_13320 [Gemmatimonadales bacterium]